MHLVKSNKALDSPHAIISGHRHSLPLQNKVNELNLKCSCNMSLMSGGDVKPPIEKSILERKQNVLLDDRKAKIVRSRKEKRDAATSPQLPNRNGTKIENGVSPCRSVTTARPSPRREIPTRNAATSPQREKCQSSGIAGGKLVAGNECVQAKPHSPNPTTPKQQKCITTKQVTSNQITSSQILNANHIISNPINLNQITPKTCTQKAVSPKPLKNPMSTKIQLEKSKSLSDTRPARQLRTTRSLSPRPPVRQQQAIIISDENDIVQVQVTPSEYFDDDDEVFAYHEKNLKIRKARGKAQSENTSPNLSNCGATFFGDDRYANNRSTGCLVYVPSDPWMKQPDKEAITGKSMHNARSATLKDKSSTLKSFDNDPWIYRRTDKNPIVNSPAKLCRQSKSMSSNIEDDTSKLSMIRPKLQRTKTPAVSDDLLIDSNYRPYSSLTIENSSTLNAQPQPSHQQISPQKIAVASQPIITKATKTGKTSIATTVVDPKRAQSFLLNVNSNMLQPRHSFSTLSPPKDDELQLNIRRLSEQIKTTSIGYQPVTNSSAADFSNYLSQMKQQQKNTMVSAATIIPAVAASATNKQTANKLNHSLCNETDIVLETTC